MNHITGGISDKRVAPDTDAWGLLGASGNAWYAAWAYSFNNASDERIKKDVEDLSDQDLKTTLDRLDTVRTVRFRYLEETAELDRERPEKHRAKPRIGVIAQSMPEEVVTEGPVLGIDLAQTLACTIAAVRGLRLEVKRSSRRWNGSSWAGVSGYRARSRIDPRARHAAQTADSARSPRPAAPPWCRPRRWQR